MTEIAPAAVPAGREGPATGGLDARRAEAMLVGAVERRSPSGQEGAVARYLVRAMAPWADHAAIDAAGNAVGRFGRGPCRVLLLGHLDTAPGWWPVRVADGIVHGRGSVDAKGSLCAFITAASRLDARCRARLSVQVVGAVEEEAATSRGARLVVAHGHRPDFVIVGEPSGWDGVTLGYKGRLRVHVAAARAEGHAARNEPTAAAQVASAWEMVRAWAERWPATRAGAFHRLQASLRSIRSHGDGLRQWAEAHIDLRLPPACAPDAAEAALRRELSTIVASGLQLRCSSPERGYRGPPDGPLARSFRLAIRAAGGRPRPLLKTGTSDLNVVAGAWSVPVVAYGPGDAALDHAPDERLALGEYARAIAVLERVLKAVAG